MINQRRAERAADVVAFYGIGEGNEDREDLVDLLTDLRHWCAKTGINFEDANRIAAGHFFAEQGGGS